MILSVTFSRDGKQVLTGSGDRRPGCGMRPAARKSALSGHFMQPGYHPWPFPRDGKQVLTGSHDNTARLWDAASGKEIRPFQGHTACVDDPWPFPPTASRCSRGVPTARLGCGMRPAVRKSASSGDTPSGTSVAFSPDGKQVLTGSPDQTGPLWDAAGGQEIQRPPRFSFEGYELFRDGRSRARPSPRTAMACWRGLHNSPVRLMWPAER